MASDQREELQQLYQREETTAARYIPAKPKIDIYGGGRMFRVCAYCRVSTDNDAQLSSFELQQQHYQQLVGNQRISVHTECQSQLTIKSGRWKYAACRFVLCCKTS